MYIDKDASVMEKLRGKFLFWWMNTTFKYKRVMYVLFEDMQWDYGFLLKGEKMKFEHMIWYFKTYSYVDDSAKIIKDLELCIMYINIITSGETLSGEILTSEEEQNMMNTYNSIRNRMLYWWD